MAKDYSLHIHNRALQGASNIMEATQRIEDWSRSTTFTGGPWNGTFKVFGERDILEQWFYEFLGYHVQEESFGAITWEGLIWEIDFVDYDKLHWTRFTQRGRRRRRTYENMFNKVLVAYNDPTDGSSGESGWFEDPVSQAVYGKKEEVIYRDVESSSSSEIASEFLAMHSYPDPQLIALEEGVNQPYLEVTVVGYVATAQFRFTTTINDNLTSIGAWVEDILDSDLEFLTKFRAASNTRSNYQSLGERMRAWDLLENLLTIRGPADEHYNLVVEPDRQISYDIWTPNPIGYYWNGALTTLNFANMEERPRLVRPGIYRDTGLTSSYPTREVSGSFFDSPQDFLLETIEVDAKGELVPRLGVYEDEEALRTFTFGKKK